MEKTLLNLLESKFKTYGYERNGVKCASLNLCYSMDVSLDEPILINELNELPTERNQEMENMFYSKLDLVTAIEKEDPMWDCSGHIWMNDGNSFTLRLRPNFNSVEVDFAWNYTPKIPEHLFNVLN